MWPAGVEPATPRVSDGRSTALSYDHASTRARPPSISPREEIDAAARLLAPSVAPSETSALFSMPLAHPSTLDRRPRADRARMVAVLRGGALEPDPQFVPKICTPNTCAYPRAYFRVNAKSLSLSSGASIRSRASSSWASPFLLFDIVRLRNDEGDPSGRPREAALRQRSSAFASPRGLLHTPTCAGSQPTRVRRAATQRHRPLRRGMWLGWRDSTYAGSFPSSRIRARTRICQVFECKDLDEYRERDEEKEINDPAIGERSKAYHVPLQVMRRRASACLDLIRSSDCAQGHAGNADGAQGVEKREKEKHVGVKCDHEPDEAFHERTRS